MVTNYILLAVCLLFIQIPVFLTKSLGNDGDDDPGIWTTPVLDNDYNWPQMRTDPTPYDRNIQFVGEQVSTNKLQKTLSELLKWFEDYYYIRVKGHPSREKSPAFSYSYYDMNN